MLKGLLHALYPCVCWTCSRREDITPAITAAGTLIWTPTTPSLAC
jgi:hypothetical protein